MDEQSSSRLSRIVTGEHSKAFKLKSKDVPSKHKTQRKRRRPRKQVKTLPRKTLKRPSLTIVLRLPLDVFIEIAHYLSIFDLLHLSRLTQHLHSVMLSNAFRRIWRRALKEIGAPDCPPDINEPQFISLICDNFCQGCNAPHVRRVDYGLRVRLCPGCASLNIIRGQRLAAKLGDEFKKDAEIFRLCYFAGASSLKPCEREQLDDKTIAAQKFFAPDFIDMARKYFSYASGSEERKQFVQDRRRVVNNIREHVSAVEKWLQRICLGKSPDAALKAMLRRSSILEELKRLGYTDAELNHEYRRIIWCKHLDQPRELNERIWRIILPRLEHILKERQAKIDEIARRALWENVKTRFRSFYDKWEKQDGKRPLFGLGDFVLRSDVKELVAKADLKQGITDSQWQTIEDPLTQAIRRFEDAFRLECASALISARRYCGLPRYFDMQVIKGPDEAVLSHAASFIFLYKTGCKWFGTYEDFELRRRENSRWHEGLWKPPVPDPDVIEIASFLLRSLGFPPKITMSEMVSLGKAFRCNCCHPSHRRRMDWVELVEHFNFETTWYESTKHLMKKRRGLKMTLIDSHNIDVSMQLASIDSELPTVEQRPYSGGYTECPICKNAFPGEQDIYYSPRRERVEAHLRSMHGVESVEEAFASTIPV